MGLMLVSETKSFSEVDLFVVGTDSATFVCAFTNGVEIDVTSLTECLAPVVGTGKSSGGSDSLDRS